MTMIAGQSGLAADAVSPAGRHGRDRWVIVAGVGGITAAAWIYVVVQARQMPTGMMRTSMAGGMQATSQATVWTAAEFGLMLLMWAVMMVAMMLPSALPMTLVYAAVARKAAREARPVAPTSAFVTGYLAMWGVFAVAATAAQIGLSHWSLLSPAMATASPVLGSCLLIGAGVYELTPLKHACLAQCRAPAHFIAHHWHAGRTGGLRTGMALGAYCLGCCWILMGLLFTGGVMNLAWIAAITLFILFEKTVSFGAAGARVAGAAMVVLGVVSLTGVIALG
jgi:predicted metal-binding membrane protein